MGQFNVCSWGTPTTNLSILFIHGDVVAEPRNIDFDYLPRSRTTNVHASARGVNLPLHVCSLFFANTLRSLRLPKGRLILILFFLELFVDCLPFVSVSCSHFYDCCLPAAYSCAFLPGTQTRQSPAEHHQVVFQRHGKRADEAKSGVQVGACRVSCGYFTTQTVRTRPTVVATPCTALRAATPPSSRLFIPCARDCSTNLELATACA